MSRRLKKAAIVSVVVFAAAQLIRPASANPATDISRSIRAQAGIASEFSAVLDRSCRDCHSNETVSAWYSKVAPLSWLMAHAVREGRKAVNFSEWTAYSQEEQRALLAQSCQDAQTGRMPGSYTLFRSDTRLSAKDVETICAAVK